MSAKGQSTTSQKFTPVETAGLRELFKGGGQKTSVAGAQNLLDQLSKEPVDLPFGVTREVLERYAELARNAINGGTDNLGVQALRLKAITQILGQ